MDKSVSWGNYPKHSCELKYFDSTKVNSNFKKNTIAFGNGRSYGDSCISDVLVDFKKYNHFLALDVTLGVLRLQSGVLLENIIALIIPKGWFLKVNPERVFKKLSL